MNILIDGKIYKVGMRIGKGGEGEIYTLQDANSIALKVYTTQDKHLREQKIDAMIKLGLANKSSLVAFPVSIARATTGEFIGFIMRLVEGHRPLHDLYSPGSRKIHFPQADYRFLVRVATNISRAVASVHNAGCVIGDINHSSMLISPRAVAALIDADSFQITTVNNKFLCKVGVPEYTPPELQGKNLSNIVRTANHDVFGLAIVIFQILFMGRHPFVGTVRIGDIPPLHENIKNFKYVYTENRNVGMDQPPGTPGISDFSQLMAEMFELAFSQNSFQSRPSAEKWVQALDKLESSLIKCDDNPLHYLPKESSECPWCEMENQLGTILFLPYFPNFGNVGGVDPGATNFNIDLIWRQIESISIDPNIQPRLSTISISPSRAVVAAKSGRKVPYVSILLLGGGIAGLIVLPVLFYIWLIMFMAAWEKYKNKTVISSEPFLKEYNEAERRWHQELENWGQRIGVKSFFELKTNLKEAKENYKQLLNEEQIQIRRYNDERRQKQLHAFLDTFDIATAKIKGIGPAKQVTLASYGIDTAADISESKLLTVPGFGQTNSTPLLQWREKLVKRFVYQQNESEIDRQEIAKIRSSVRSKLAATRQKLNSGQNNLASIAQKIRSAVAIEDPMLNLVNKQKVQAKVDLEFLGVRVPTYIPQTSRTGNLGSIGFKHQPTILMSPTPSTGTNAITCPRCSSTMVKRLARRGRNAGNYFWGCSRYPQCKGTRNI